MAFYSTVQAAKMLNISPQKLGRLVWLGQVDKPQQAPSGDYLWDENSLNRASWVIRHREFRLPENEPAKKKVIGLGASQ